MQHSIYPQTDFIKGRCDYLASANSNSIVFISLCMVVFLKSTLYDLLPGLGSVCNVALVVLLLYFVAIMLGCRLSSRLLAIMALYFVWDIVLAPCLAGTTPPSAFFACEALACAMFFYQGLSFHPSRFLHNLSCVFAFASLLNLVMLLMFPEGVYSTEDTACWLFGNRTSMPLVFMPAICISLASDSFSGRKTFSPATWINILAALTCVLLRWVATGIIQLLVVAALYLYLLRKKSFSILFVFGAIICGGFLLLALGPSDLWQNFFEALGREATLTGRTEIWAHTFMHVSESPWFGWGDENYVVINNVIKAAHCLWLSVLQESGIFGLLIYASIMVYVIVLLARRPTPLSYVAFCCLAGILVASFVEIQTYYPFFYGVLIVCCFTANDTSKSTIPLPVNTRRLK